MDYAIGTAVIVGWLVCSALAAYLYGWLGLEERDFFPAFFVAVWGPVTVFILGAIWIYRRGQAARERKP